MRLMSRLFRLISKRRSCLVSYPFGCSLSVSDELSLFGRDCVVVDSGALERRPDERLN
jgi:hypothetical protein